MKESTQVGYHINIGPVVDVQVASAFGSPVTIIMNCNSCINYNFQYKYIGKDS